MRVTLATQIPITYIKNLNFRAKNLNQNLQIEFEHLSSFGPQ